ncbi:hypothetical protein [Rhizobium sp. P44RR-XXIV]|uniref:hypothetical protein n=1 Tax=Rhizobium sp. P44RR-XXIV TaxID=1921145 RepID=UPI000985A34B|nr:hypothetical protein [Rhizobium sp. P44RR-XXIV]TIX86970.1 hypothetical protein BSK43_028925 [Rhizobium sp. P44RR-XXIV]
MRRCFARRTRLWAGAIICNAAFSLIGASPRQFILFNMLILLTLSARSFHDMTRVESFSSRDSSPVTARWKPLILYVMDLLVACYAMTVFIDNLATAPTLVETLR